MRGVERGERAIRGSIEQGPCEPSAYTDLGRVGTSAEGVPLVSLPSVALEVRL